MSDWRSATGLTGRERLAAEFAERFAIDHLAMDDELWGRLHAAFSEDELADLTICCGCFLGISCTWPSWAYVPPTRHLVLDPRSRPASLLGLACGKGLDHARAATSSWYCTGGDFMK